MFYLCSDILTFILFYFLYFKIQKINKIVYPAGALGLGDYLPRHGVVSHHSPYSSHGGGQSASQPPPVAQHIRDLCLSFGYNT